MSVNERSSSASAGANSQGAGTAFASSTGGPNNSDEQVEPSSTFGIFSVDFKK